MVRLAIGFEGAAEAAKALRDVDARLQGDRRPLLQSIGEEMASSFQAGIAGGTLDLPELSWVTQKIRKHYGHDGKQKLIRSGDLLHSIRPLSYEDDVVFVGTDMEFPGASAKTLHDGGTVTEKSGRTHEVPAFPFLVPTELLLDDLQSMVADYFAEAQA